MALGRISEQTWRRIVAVWILAFTVSTFYAITQNRKLGREGRQAHDALCTFRADLARRAEEGAAYADDIRTGRRAPIPGITIADIQRSVDAQRATLRTLHVLNCG